MQDCKPISAPIPINYKLSSSMTPSSKAERIEMSQVPYASAMGCLIYSIICTRPGIAKAVGVVSRFIANPGRGYWNGAKRILRYIRGTSSETLCSGGSEFFAKG